MESDTAGNPFALVGLIVERDWSERRLRAGSCLPAGVGATEVGVAQWFTCGRLRAAEPNRECPDNGTPAGLDRGGTSLSAGASSSPVHEDLARMSERRGRLGVYGLKVSLKLPRPARLDDPNEQ